MERGVFRGPRERPGRHAPLRNSPPPSRRAPTLLPLAQGRRKSTCPVARDDGMGRTARPWMGPGGRSAIRRPYPIDRFGVAVACGAARTVGAVDGAILSTDGDTPYAAARAAIIAACGFARLRILNADLHQDRDGVRGTIWAAGPPGDPLCALTRRTAPDTPAASPRRGAENCAAGSPRSRSHRSGRCASPAARSRPGPAAPPRSAGAPRPWPG